MSGSVWAVNAGRGELVGQAAVSSGLWTLNDHGLQDGQPVMLDDIAGLDVVTGYGLYHVRDADDDTFRLAGSLGGEPIAAGSGTADVHLVAGVKSASQLRRLSAVNAWAGVADRLGARQGVRPGGGPVLELSGTTWTVRAHAGRLYPGLTTASGPYDYEVAEHSGSVDPADGAQPRVDVVVVGVADDDEDSSGERGPYAEYIAGSPGGGAPSTPQGAMRLGRINVPASGQGSPTLTYDAPFTVSSGGILPVPTPGDLPSSGVGDPMFAWVMSTGELYGRHGGSWEKIAPTDIPPPPPTPFRGYAEASDSTQTTSEAYTGVSVTVPSGSNPSGAQFMVRISGHISSTNNGDSGDLRVRRGTSTGSPLVISSREVDLRSSGRHLGGQRRDTPGGGSVTYGLFIARITGSGTIADSSGVGFRSTLTVERWNP